MAALMKNVSGKLGLYRALFTEPLDAIFLTKSSLRFRGAKLFAISNGAVSARYLSSLKPGFERQGNDSFRSFRSKDDEPFHENVEELSKLSKSHRDITSSEHFTTENKSFSEFPLHPTLLAALDNLGYKSPFEIQCKTLEHTLEGRDVIGQAATGSGKTLAFAIPIVNLIRKQRIDAKEKADRCPRAIVVAPTRELCNQIFRSIQELDPQVRCVALYGGDSYIRQEKEMLRGIDVVCATPGRLNDHIEKNNIKLDKLRFLCLDEADQLLNPNFKDQIEGLFRNSPTDKQILMFSATMPPEVQGLATRFIKDPEIVSLGSQLNQISPQNIEHRCICTPSNLFLSTVVKMIKELNAERCIVFLKTKIFCGIFANNLRRFGFNVDALHSDMSQSRRERILSSFRMGDLQILCATDVAARGLDIPEVDAVFQVEPPANGIEYYIHRSGRTGRAGRKGVAVLLHTGTREEMNIIREIGRLVDLKHITTKNDIVDDIREANLEDALKKLKTLNLSKREKELVEPIAEKLLATEDNKSLLSNALALLARVNNIHHLKTDIEMSQDQFQSKTLGSRMTDSTFSRPRDRTFNSPRDRTFDSPRDRTFNTRPDRNRQSRSLWDDD